ncbi:MAG: hypothetical protein HYY17_09840 [Planctomycetes bacterium]|nr:hypothetical protein [Planctomycetota bacterium]
MKDEKNGEATAGGPVLRLADPSGVPRAVSHGTEASLPRLLLWKRDLCIMLGVKLRTLERMISAGEVPAPDRRLRGRPAWLAATIHEWAERGCPAAVEK